MVLNYNPTRESVSSPSSRTSLRRRGETIEIFKGIDSEYVSFRSERHRSLPGRECPKEMALARTPPAAAPTAAKSSNTEAALRPCASLRQVLGEKIRVIRSYVAVNVYLSPDKLYSSNRRPFSTRDLEVAFLGLSKPIAAIKYPLESA